MCSVAGGGQLERHWYSVTCLRTTAGNSFAGKVIEIFLKYTFTLYVFWGSVCADKCLLRLSLISPGTVRCSSVITLKRWESDIIIRASPKKRGGGNYSLLLLMGGAAAILQDSDYSQKAMKVVLRCILIVSFQLSGFKM